MVSDIFKEKYAPRVLMEMLKHSGPVYLSNIYKKIKNYHVLKKTVLMLRKKGYLYIEHKKIRGRDAMEVSLTKKGYIIAKKLSLLDEFSNLPVDSLSKYHGGRNKFITIKIAELQNLLKSKNKNIKRISSLAYELSYLLASNPDYISTDEQMKTLEKISDQLAKVFTHGDKTPWVVFHTVLYDLENYRESKDDYERLYNLQLLCNDVMLSMEYYAKMLGYDVEEEVSEDIFNISWDASPKLKKKYEKKLKKYFDDKARKIINDGEIDESWDEYIMKKLKIIMRIIDSNGDIKQLEKLILEFGAILGKYPEMKLSEKANMLLSTIIKKLPDVLGPKNEVKLLFEEIVNLLRKAYAVEYDRTEVVEYVKDLDKLADKAWQQYLEYFKV